MGDCSTCLKAIEINPMSHVCNTESAKYVISNYPSQGEGCATYEPNQGRKIVNVNVKKQDPLLSFLQRRKDSKVDEAERKIVEAYERNMGLKEGSIHIPLPQNVYPTKVSNEEINFKHSLGWITSAILSGVLISLWLLGMIKP